MHMLAAIDDPKRDSTASHPSSSSHSLPRCVVCHPGHLAPTIMGGLVLWLQSTYCRYPLVGSRFRFRLRLWREPSVSAVVSVTAITGRQLRRQLRLWPKPVFYQKNWFRSVSIRRVTIKDVNQWLVNKSLVTNHLQ